MKNHPRSTYAARLKKQQKLTGTYWCALVAGVCWPGTVDTAPAASDADSPPDKIVVTALKRETTLLETPISISAVTGETLEKTGADDLADYLKFVPSLDIRDNGPGQRRPVIRGVQGAGESQVGLYYGEIPVTGTPGTTNDAGRFQPDLNLFDVNRIEVLRGPQGTLHGAGSMGGTLRILFNEPDPDQFLSKAAGDFSGTENGGFGFKLNGMANMPLVTNKLALRLVGYGQYDSGYIDNVALGIDNINENTNHGGRAQLGWFPADNVTIMATAIYQKTDVDGGFHSQKDVGDLQTNIPIHEPWFDEVQMYNVKADWDMADIANLVATSSYYKRENEFNFTLLFLPPLASEDPLGLSPGAIANQPQDVEIWSHELRLSSVGENLFDWTIGGFWQDRNAFVTSNVPFAGPGGRLDTSYTPFVIRTVDSTYENRAVFSEVTLNLTDRLAVTGGARYFDLTIANTPITLISLFEPVPPSTPVTASFNEDGVTTKAHISYHATDEVLVYAQRTEGFRAGGPNQTIVGFTIPAGYESDSVTNYEIGAKGALFDGLVTFAGAYYHIIWDNIQTEGTDPSGLVRFTSNAGEATIDGVELEIFARPNDNLDLSFGFNWNDATLSETGNIVTTTTLPDGSPGSRSGIAGDRIPAVPNFTFFGSAEYSRPVFDNGLGFVRVDVSYTGDSVNAFRPFLVDADGVEQLDAPNAFFAKHDGYTAVDLRVGVESDTWRASAYVMNVANTRGETFSFIDDFRAPPGYTYYICPRTIGLSFSVQL